ncbi:hypothetical protein EYF80_012604 [Liparis tanakae]|uniref:Uncharacterized protein n=1 Tax=Liparis tanakae TaxID=230148 RepID=A0A4Z2IHG7_9TELE|nr:hypothetical protein EYF80_012604 [Liparis tanakae]
MFSLAGPSGHLLRTPAVASEHRIVTSKSGLPFKFAFTLPPNLLVSLNTNATWNGFLFGAGSQCCLA